MVSLPVILRQKRIILVNQDSFVYSVRKIAVPTPSGVAIKMDKRTRKMVPIIVEKMPPCRPISSGDEKITPGSNRAIL